MKDIKKIASSLLLLFLFVNCTKDEDSKVPDNNFVRFSLLLDKNGEIIDYPKVLSNVPETAIYNHVSTKIIKIPVILTSNLRTSPLDVFYEVQTEGNFTDFTIAPQGKITIPVGKLIDTVRININSRWQGVNSNKIFLKIVRTSDPSVNIGWKNPNFKMDKVTINLGDLSKTRYFFNQNLYNIVGSLNEEVLIPIQFSQPVTNAMVGNFNFILPQFTPISNCDGVGSSFNYLLEKLPFIDGATKIFYKFKVLSTTQFAANLRLTLNTGLTDFIIFGTAVTNIRKPDQIVRQGNPAANWYNVADALNRNYGKAWFFSTTDGFCRWSNTFQTFTKPVPVSIGSEFDNGQGYHKFKIGYVANNLPVGTNPFDFVRFYNGASVESPAFTIREALEFFPDNGTSTTSGTVKVIAQTLTFIKTANSATVGVPICGIGNYSFNSVLNRWEMYLEIHCNETAINGNPDVVRAMYIYSNNNNNSNPVNLTIPCSNRINL